MTPLVSAAHSYLAAGLTVLALDGKAPNSTIHPRGLNNALVGVPEEPSDDRLIEQVFTHPRTTGIGIVITAPYLVVDIDGNEGAVAFLDIVGPEWQLSEEMTRTPIAATGRGLHIWYSDWPNEWRSMPIADKLDLKGIGGYVAAPPSVHPSGRVYEWLSPFIGSAPMMIPDRLRGYLLELVRVKATPSYETPIQQRSYVLRDGVFRVEAIPASMGGLSHAIRTAKEGTRNGMLAWAAMSAYEDGFSLDEALDELGEAALAAGLPDREVKTTIRNAYRRKSRR